MKNAILYGNGFNLLTPNSLSWNDLLNNISNKCNSTITNDILPTLQYEQILLHPKARFDSLPNKNDGDETKVKKAIADTIRKTPSNTFYKLLLDMPVSYYLTTNYDHAIYNNDESLISSKESTENVYSIYRWKRIVTSNKEFLLYNIHGDIDKAPTIMMGFDQYVGYVARVQNYVKGEYHKNGSSIIIPQLIKRIKDDVICLDANHYGIKDPQIGPFSWIDHFFFSNLHIIGLSLDFSEIDIWWLLLKRARLLKDRLIHNKIFYYPTCPPKEMDKYASLFNIMHSLNIDIINYHVNRKDYKMIYKEQLDNMRDRMENI